MRAFYAYVLFALIASFSARAEAPQRPVLDCNFNFDYIAQIQIFEEPSGGHSFRLLTNTGRWLDKQHLPAAQWEAKDIRFDARGRNFDGGHYRFYSRNGGRHWSYEVRIRPDVSPSTIGAADCD